MTSYMNRDDHHLQTPGEETAAQLREKLRSAKLEVEAERALRLDAEAALNEEQKAHGKIRVLAQLAAVKYKAECELRAAAIDKMREREYRGSPLSEARGEGVAFAIDAIERSTDA